MFVLKAYDYYATDYELEIMPDIAISVAPTYAMSKLMLERQSVDRNAAAQIITDISTFNADSDCTRYPVCSLG